MGMVVTLLTLYNHSSGLFSKMLCPEMVSRQTLINNILLECGDFGVIYTNPELMKEFIRIWSEKNIIRWQQLVETMHYQYNPIHNYDRTETRTSFSNNYETIGTAHNLNSETNSDRNINDGYSEDQKGTGKQNGNEESTRTPDLIDKFDGDTKTYISGYNAPTPVLKDHTVTDNTDHHTGTEQNHIENSQNATSEVHTQSQRLTNDNSNVKGTTKERSLQDRSDNRYDTEEIRAYGNIGVKSTQSMIAEQREIVDFSIIEIIIAEFKKEFCIMVY